VSQESLPGSVRLRLAVPMVGRDPEEDHRAATPLELFFDLIFVVAVAFASERLHHSLVVDEVVDGVIALILVFFAIWWAWVNFTWFSSAYDTDDVTYRIFVFVTMTGALILAAGVPRAFDERDFDVATLGYVVMRLALVTQWIRVAMTDTQRRVTARRFAVGVAACQVGWVAALLLPGDWWVAAFVVLAPAELLVPAWAESASRTTWHEGHIAERYGLFMIIVLGESVLAASLAIRSATEGDGLIGELIPIIVGGLLALFSMWWIYFDRPEERLLASERGVFIWSYAHLFVFGSVATFGTGLAASIDGATGHSELGQTATGLAVGIPVVIYLLSLYAVYVRPGDSLLRRFGIPVTAMLILLTSFTTQPVLLTGLLLTALVVAKEIERIRGEGLAPNQRDSVEPGKLPS